MGIERYYTYKLSYPKSMGGAVFYVGEGIGDRIDQHEREAKAGKKSEKCMIIREIWAHGEEVVKEKVGFFDTKVEAQVHETSLIASHEGLSNISKGRKIVKPNMLKAIDRFYFGYSIMKFNKQHQEYYDAREVASFLGYTRWKSFMQVIERTIEYWDEKTMGEISSHFVTAIMPANKGQNGSNYHLSREAFTAVTLRSDPRLTPVAVAQNYFAGLVAAYDQAQMDASHTDDYHF